MPLSKARNKERMRQIRRNKRLLPPQESKSVQPEGVLYHLTDVHSGDWDMVDANGEVIPDYD